MEKTSLQNDIQMASWTYGPDTKIIAKKKGGNFALMTGEDGHR